MWSTFKGMSNMTREEFMKHAEKEVEQAFRGQRNRMMNLVEQAWAEGKRNAELAYLEGIVNELKQSLVNAQQTQFVSTTAYIPPACKNCSNHPSNGGNGVCFCTLGSQVTY